MKHQKEGLRMVLNESSFALFMEQGTGKTPLMIKAVEERYKAGDISRVILFAPATLLYNWELELRKFLSLPKKSYVIHRLDDKNKKRRDDGYNKFLKNDFELCTLAELKAKGYIGTKKSIVESSPKKLMVLLVNYEKSLSMFKQLKKFKPHQLVIDESHKVKGRKAKRSKKIKAISKPTNFRNILTGTPMPNGFEDIWMQFNIMDETIFGTRFKDFENDYIRKGGYMGKQVVGYKNKSRLRRKIKQHSYIVRIEDCIDLPPVSMKYMTCGLSSEASKAYKEVSENMFTEIDSILDKLSRSKLKRVCRKHDIYYEPDEPYVSLLMRAKDHLETSTCDLVITQSLRLHQICGGFLTLNSGEKKYLGSEKLSTLKDIAEDTRGPLVVFCQYVAEINRVVEELSTTGLVVKSYRDKKTRDKVYKEYLDGKIDVLVLQASSGSTGLNLQRSNRMVLYSINNKGDDYVQMISRIKRNGQKRNMEIIHLLVENSMDEIILKSVQDKNKLVDDLLYH